jgi:LacI family transcriptional regulator
MAKVVILDVAKEAAVSKTTVSNYFNMPEKLSPEVSERIRVAIDKLGYVRSDAARQLRAGRSNVIGYVMFELGNTYFSDVANAIERRAAEAGLFVVLGNNGGNHARETSYLELFESQGVRGIIVAPVGPVDSLLATIRKRGTPSVITGRDAISEEQPSVSVQNTRGGYLATKHLIEIGKKHLAFVGGPLDIRQVSDRLLGATQAVREYGDVSLEIYPTDDRTIAVGRDVADRLLRGELGRRPDGIFTANDALGIGLIDGIVSNSDIRVPEQLAVIGFDDLDIASSGSIPLSSVRTSHEDFGRMAVELLLAELGDIPPLPTKHVVFDPEIVTRASTIGDAIHA